jgi:hypothetical protein
VSSAYLGSDFDALQSQGAADSLQWDYEVDAEQFKSAVLHHVNPPPATP